MATKFFTNEFEDNAGWHCMNDTDLGNGSNEWWRFPRSINMPLDKYVEVLIKDFKVDKINFIGDNVLSFSWKKQSDMRKFKNWANRKYREII